MNNTPYIGFWKRAVAFTVDGILISIPPAVLCLPVIFWQAAKMVQTEGTPAADGHLAAVVGVYLLWQVLGIVCFWLYFALLESGKKQATFGKRMMGIKVVDYQGGRIGFGRATGRTFAKMLSYLIMYIGFIMAGTTNRKRALHDFIAQTYVVRADFQPGGELPDTKSHPVWLWLISLLLGMTAVLAGFIALLADATPALQANLAARRLQAFALQPQLLQEPAEVDGVAFSRTREGVQARFETSGEDFILRLRRSGEPVCCEGLNCNRTGFPECD